MRSSTPYSPFTALRAVCCWPGLLPTRRTAWAWAGTKVGVIATTDDAGAGLLAGVKRENEDLKAQLTVQEVEASATDFSAAVNVLKNAGCVW